MAPRGSPDSQEPGSDDLARKRRLFRAYETNKQRELTEQRLSRKYYHSKQYTDHELKVFRDRKQPVITSNRVKHKINFMVGVEQRQRRDPKAYPRNPGDQPAADVATAAVRFVCDINRWEQIASTGASDGYVSGIGVVWVGIRPERDGRLEVKMRPGQVDRFFYDPRSVEHDFGDARYMGMHLWYDVDEAKARWPDKVRDLESVMDSGETTWTVDQDRDTQWGDFESRRIRVVEMWERRSTPNGEAWYYCFFTGSIELESGWSPYRDEHGLPDCPYVAWTPYVDEVGDRYGLMRDMRPLQDEINHRRSKFLHLLNSNQMHVRTGLVDDMEDFRKQKARPDGILEHNGTWGQDIGVVDRSVEMQGQAELLTEAKSELENIGANPGLVGKGAGVANASGRALLTQRDSGITELAPVLDRLRDWKLRVYRKMWAYIRQSWTEERYIRITDNPDAPRFLGINAMEVDPRTGMPRIVNAIGEIDVDIIMEEGPDVITMQDELLERLAQLGPAAMSPLGRIIIELSGTPNKDRLLEMMDKAMAPAPPNPAQQIELEQRTRANEAKIDETESKAALNRANAMEKSLQAQLSQMAPPTIEQYGSPASVA